MTLVCVRISPCTCILFLYDQCYCYDMSLLCVIVIIIIMYILYLYIPQLLQLQVGSVSQDLFSSEVRSASPAGSSCHATWTAKTRRARRSRRRSHRWRRRQRWMEWFPREKMVKNRQETNGRGFPKSSNLFKMEVSLKSDQKWRFPQKMEVSPKNGGFPNM